VAVIAWRLWRRRSNSSKVTVSEDEAESRGLVWAVGDGGRDELKVGRQRKPGAQWLCTRCGRMFSISPDVVVPTPWWVPAANQWKAGETAPWACPDCGTYAYTVPREQ
jgi:rubrerythrin